MATETATGVNQGMSLPSDQQMIEAYCESQRRLGHSLETIRLRRQVLTRLSDELPYSLAEATADELKEWVYQRKWGTSTWSTYLTCVRSFFAWASNPRDAWISFNPALELEAVSPARGCARPCTDEDLGLILTKAAEPYRTWAKLAAYQGLRCVEISGLDREHVTEQLFRVVRGKGGKPRLHDTHPLVWEAIRSLPPGPVARLVRSGERASATYVSIRASRHFTEIGAKDVTMHMLRHWLGVNTQRLYRDIRVTQAVLGHESLSSTQIYTMATMDQQREARSMLPRLGG